MSERAYTWDADDYARNSQVHFGWARQLIEHMALRETDAVLDIGCGDGKITAAIAERCARGRVVGVDRSPAMAALAQARFAAGTHRDGRLSFCVMDAARLSCAPVFDAAFSTAALHWVKDHPAVLAGVHAALKPGGRLLFQMGGKGNARHMLEALEEVMQRPRWREYFRGFEFPYSFHAPEDYHPWLAQAGLEAQRVELVPKDMPHPDTDSLVSWLRTAWLPYHEPVPASLRPDFFAEAASAYTAQHPPGGDGLLHVQMVRLEVEARKPRAGVVGAFNPWHRPPGQV